MDIHICDISDSDMTWLVFDFFRCTLGEKKILDLEEELRVVGQNLQQLEVNKSFQTK